MRACRLRTRLLLPRKVAAEPSEPSAYSEASSSFAENGKKAR